MQDSNDAVINYSLPFREQYDVLKGGSVYGPCPPRQYLPNSNHHLAPSCGLEEQHAVLGATAVAAAEGFNGKSQREAHAIGQAIPSHQATGFEDYGNTMLQDTMIPNNTGQDEITSTDAQQHQQRLNPFPAEMNQISQEHSLGQAQPVKKRDVKAHAKRQEASSVKEIA